MKTIAWAAVILWCAGSVFYTWVYYEPDNRAWDTWPLWLQALEFVAIVTGLAFLSPFQLLRSLFGFQ